MRLETLKLDSLNPAKYNPRTITTDEFNGLCESLKTFGQQENLIVNKDMTIISGHQRFEAMKYLGWTEAVCNVVDLDKKHEKKLNVLMNSQAISGKYDDLKLSEILEELKLDDDYESLRLDKLEPLDLSDIEVEEDEAPEVSQEPPVSKLGEVYQLGRHRVMCGDSTEFGQVSDLMDGKQVDMVFTDPPYSVNYSKKNKEILGAKEYTEITNDNLSVKDTASQIWKPVFDNLAEIAKDDCSIYCTMPQGGDQMMMMMMDRWQVKHELIWVKESPVFSMNRLDYDYKHEPIAYGWMKKHNWYGKGEHTKSVWEIHRDGDKSHPTMKPIALIANAILNSTKEDDMVVDLFLGSGSTLIACEQTDRTCYGMELDPKYIDVIRKRYWKFINDGNEEGWEDGTPSGRR